MTTNSTTPREVNVIDHADMRKVLDEQTEINNGLSAEDREFLAAAMTSGRYLLHVEYIERTDKGNRIIFRYNAVDYPDLMTAPKRLAKAIDEEMGHDSFEKAIQKSRINHAIPDLGE